ncbi:Sphingosine N-acyltransferase lac1 [Talaromyces islandicus]|uniref:Sphingosine N-acyltransferase lac1 n=1 Tax=Talaromyces islandicus TaxID=28573 RepID=A0A0U1M5X7_TALIS|nr:Sphingosine N-acyltransferase lac1 [Talaromyces islandicus]
MAMATSREPGPSAQSLRYREIDDNARGSELPSRRASVKNDRQQIFSKRRTKSRSLVRRWKRFALKHTWTIPLILLSVFVLFYAINPTESNLIHHFIFLSYKQQTANIGSDSAIVTPPKYGKGPWDIAFVIFYTIFLSFTREFIMQELLRPIAHLCGIASRAKQARFMEQMYTAIYFGFMGPAGLYVMRQTPVWYFNASGMYDSFPHRALQAEFKFYYLFQAAYWAQQAIVMLLGLEKPRKDYKELVAHHIVTLALIGLSYRFHFTYMGIAVYLTHDISDFFLAVSKSLHYLDASLTVPFYGISLGSWVYLRNYLNIRIIVSLFFEFQTVGPYELNWEMQQYKCWISNIITFVLLASLQALNLFWLYLVLDKKSLGTQSFTKEKKKYKAQGELIMAGVTEESPPAVEKGDGDDPEYIQLSPADEKLENEIDFGVKEIKKLQDKKESRLHEYAQDNANTKTLNLAKSDLTLLMKCLIKDMKEFDTFISSKKQELLKKCELFSNKEYADRYVKPSIHDVSKTPNKTWDLINRLGLVTVTGEYVVSMYR